MSTNSTTIGFNPQQGVAIHKPNNKSNTTNEQESRLIALIELANIIDQKMQKHLNTICKNEPFFKCKGEEITKILDKFYIKYYETF